MSIFKKRKDAPKPEDPEQGMKAPHAEPPAPDAAAVIGGLDWYRAQFHRAMKLALALTVALSISLIVAALLLLNQPKPQYFAATPDLRLAPMVPLDQPLLQNDGDVSPLADHLCGLLGALERRAVNAVKRLIL